MIITGNTVATEAVMAESVPAMLGLKPIGVVPGATGTQAVKMVTRQTVSNKVRRGIGSSPKKIMKLAPYAHSFSDQVCIYKTLEGEKSSYGFAFAVYAFQYHRIGRGWRALGLLESDTITWF